MQNPKFKKILSKKEIEAVFKKIEKLPQVGHAYQPSVAPKGTTEGWVTTGGSSKFDNTLISISQWQTGQKF